MLRNGCWYFNNNQPTTEHLLCARHFSKGFTSNYLIPQRSQTSSGRPWDMLPGCPCSGGMQSLPSVWTAQPRLDRRTGPPTCCSPVTHAHTAARRTLENSSQVIPLLLTNSEKKLHALVPPISQHHPLSPFLCLEQDRLIFTCRRPT